MRWSLGCFSIALLSCTSCCCLRIPTFGLWPELDEAQVAEAVRNAPLVVDHLCQRGEECVAVEGAKIEVYPLAWGPIFDEVTAIVEVEATCKASEDGSLKPITCAGILLASYDAAGAGPVFKYVSEEMFFGNEPSGLSYEDWSDSLDDGGDWD